MRNGGPAFPVRAYTETDSSDGMTLRDYFAAKAIQGMLADPNVRDMDSFVMAAPAQAYAVADAMLKERSHAAPGEQEGK